MALIELYRSGRQREALTDVGGVGVGRRPRSETLLYFFSDPRFLHFIAENQVQEEERKRSPSRVCRVAAGNSLWGPIFCPSPGRGRGAGSRAGAVLCLGAVGRGVV